MATMSFFKGKMAVTGDPVVSNWSKGSMLTAGRDAKPGVLGKTGAPMRKTMFGINVPAPSSGRNR